MHNLKIFFLIYLIITPKFLIDITVLIQSINTQSVNEIPLQVCFAVNGIRMFLEIWMAIAEFNIEDNELRHFFLKRTATVTFIRIEIYKLLRFE